jgi:hypothetical protein
MKLFAETAQVLDGWGKAKLGMTVEAFREQFHAPECTGDATLCVSGENAHLFWGVDAALRASFRAGRLYEFSVFPAPGNKNPVFLSAEFHRTLMRLTQRLGTPTLILPMHPSKWTPSDRQVFLASQTNYGFPHCEANAETLLD